MYVCVCVCFVYNIGVYNISAIKHMCLGDKNAYRMCMYMYKIIYVYTSARIVYKQLLLALSFNTDKMCYKEKNADFFFIIRQISPAMSASSFSLSLPQFPFVPHARTHTHNCSARSKVTTGERVLLLVDAWLKFIIEFAISFQSFRRDARARTFNDCTNPAGRNATAAARVQSRPPV